MSGKTRTIGAAMVIVLGLLAACSSDGEDEGSVDTSTTTEVELTGTIDLAPDLLADAPRCDPIAEGCLLPFPNDYYTQPAETPTGLRVDLTAEALPANVSGVHIDPKHWNDLDGFSPAAAPLVQIADVDLEASGTARVSDPSSSLDDDSPVVLLDLTDGTRIGHWVELDVAANETDEVPTLMVRPTRLLPEGHEIAVAMRGLVDTSGAPVEPSDVFRAYRDRLDSGEALVEDRRPAMESLFAGLAEVGVAREDLQLAWSFTVASQESLSSRLLHIRDDAFARIAEEPTSFTVTEDVPSEREGIARELSGTYEVPSYLSGEGGPGSEFVLDDDGMPTHTGSYTADFKCLVPAAASADSPAGTGLYGHGLLGTADQVRASAEQSARGNRVFCATDLIGMADPDLLNAAKIVTEFSTFNTLADRLQQGHLNTLVLGRLLVSPDGFGTDPAFQDDGTSILTDDLVYYGISQGGIMGAATTAVAQDWTLAVLDVTGLNYGLLLDRSVDFDDFRAVMVPSYPSPADRTLALQLIQMLWDRGEATGYVQHLTDDPYADTPEHRVLLHVAYGDHQVTPLAAAIEARTIGASAVRPALADGRGWESDPFWDIPSVETFPFEGSALVMWDSGAAVPPETNVPPREGDDPHSDPRNTPAANDQIQAFLERGEVIDVCGDAACVGIPRE